MSEKKTITCPGHDTCGIANIINTYDRPADATAERTFARAGKYNIVAEDKPGKRIPKAGVYAAAGVGHASAEYSVFEAEAKGPNASAGIEANAFGAGAMVQAEVASASAKAGPVGVKVGIGFDTGASAGLGGVEAKLMGTGINLSLTRSVAVLGSEVECSVM